MEKQTVAKQSIEKATIEKQTYAIGDRVEKLCAVCQEERGHVVASITKRGLISRVTCPKCGTRGSFSNGAKLTRGRSKSVNSEPYDRTRTYRAGQTMSHPIWGASPLMQERRIALIMHYLACSGKLTDRSLAMQFEVGRSEISVQTSGCRFAT